MHICRYAVVHPGNDSLDTQLPKKEVTWNFSAEYVPPVWLILDNWIFEVKQGDLCGLKSHIMQCYTALHNILIWTYYFVFLRGLWTNDLYKNICCLSFSIFFSSLCDAECALHPSRGQQRVTRYPIWCNTVFVHRRSPMTSQPTVPQATLSGMLSAK